MPMLFCYYILNRKDIAPRDQALILDRSQRAFPLFADIVEERMASER
jgi:hypothetical protein